MMTVDLTARAAELQKKMQENNPANLTTPPRAERVRVPMTAPLRKLSVPPIEGYETFWILGKADRIAQAQAAWYEFVRQDEVTLADTRIGGDVDGKGTDLGDRVSIVAGDEIDHTGQPVRLYLMKVKKELYEEDMNVIHERNREVADALTTNFRRGRADEGAPGQAAGDAAQTYVDPTRSQVQSHFFTPKRRA